MNKNLCKTVLDAGGYLVPLIIPNKDTDGTGLMNPSIFVYNNKLIVNIRHINYTLWHSEAEQRFNNKWGPLAYLHPENDIHLKTNNFIATLNDNLEIEEYHKVHMTLDVSNPMWEFHGLEDARLVQWGDKLYMSGVRRDTTPNGVGRIELSEIKIDDNGIRELSRVRTEPPGAPSYCEKNWMPILDTPYHYIKWCNATQVVKVDPITGVGETAFLSHITLPNLPDFRGGSQVINWMGLKMAIVHQVDLFNNKLGQKDGSYDHRLIIWDNTWNIVHITDPFKFMTGLIEFCAGMTIYKGDLIISFGFQDNSSYLLKIPGDKIEEVFNFKYENFSLNKTPNKEKYDKFPPVYYISFVDSKNRRDLLEKQLNAQKIDATAIITTSESDRKNVVRGKFLDQLTPWHTNVTASHLKAIKYWYNNSDTPYALFFEDDVTLETMDHWNFSWSEFINNLPNDWDCIQLCCIRQNLSEIKLRKREWDDWSVTAYLMTRDYAKKLINEYYPNEEFNLDIRGINVLPITENILFLLGNTYTIPLFAENPNIKTTYNQDDSDIKKSKNEFEIHEESSKFILNWWKTIGKTIDIKNVV